MWKRGQKAELARRAGISRSHLVNILARRSRAKAELAEKLAEACKAMRLKIKREDWVFSQETDNQYFKAVGE